MSIAFDDPVKSEIWATVRAMNDAWTKGNPDDLAGFFHRNMVAVSPSVRRRLQGAAACVADWKDFATRAGIRRWKELDAFIHVYQDAAVVLYHFDMSVDMGSETMDTGGRDMLFFIKENGRWWAVANQFSLDPA